MSFNRVTTLPDHACIEAIIDGHEDWDSATDVIVEMTEAAEAQKLSRILIDFTQVNLRIARSEAPDIAKFFDSYATYRLDIGVRLPAGERDSAVIGSFANTMQELGHSVSFLRSDADRHAWLAGPQRKVANG